MPGPKPAMRARPGGGFNQGIGHFNEHMDEAAMQQAAQQNALGQQASQPSQQQIAQQALQQKAQQGVPQHKPGEKITSLKEELVDKPIQDFVEAGKSFFDIYNWLGMERPEFQTPEEKAKEKQLHQRFNQLTKDEQRYVQQKYQKELQEKQQREQEEEQRKQQQAQQSQTIAPPSSPQKGPKGPGGSKKQKATQKLQDDRQKLGGPGGSN